MSDPPPAPIPYEEYQKEFFAWVDRVGFPPLFNNHHPHTLSKSSTDLSLESIMMMLRKATEQKNMVDQQSRNIKVLYMIAGDILGDHLVNHHQSNHPRAQHLRPGEMSCPESDWNLPDPLAPPLTRTALPFPQRGVE